MSFSGMYAVESYGEESGYCRHDVGTKDEMVRLLDDLVHDSIRRSDYGSYYRVTEISDADYREWMEQVEKLPDVENTDKVFGEWIQIGVAAKYLDVTFGRVFNLVTDGEIRSNTVGRNKLVSVHDVVQRKINKPKAGRPPKKPVQAPAEDAADPNGTDDGGIDASDGARAVDAG